MAGARAIAVMAVCCIAFPDVASADVSVVADEAPASSPAAVAAAGVGPPDPDLLEKTEADVEAEFAADEGVVTPDPEGEPLDFSRGPPAALAPTFDPCRQYNDDYASWIDQSQMGIYRTVCGATAWFDGFFGDSRYDQQSGQTFGRISFGGFWDELGGFDTSLRFRARFALPALSKRTSLLIGRGDEDNLIAERYQSDSDQLARRPTDGTDDATVVGLGYRALDSLKRDLSFSVGARLRSGLVPIAKVKYRRSWQISERDLLQFLPLVYWRSDEGLGSTLRVDIDHGINRDFLLRWSNYANVSENKDAKPIQDDDPNTPDFEIDGIKWGSTVYLYQALSRRRAITYSAFVTGNSDTDVSYQNAGFDVRYRQRILREWLFIEYSTGVNWPRQYSGVQRERNIGAGVRLEAYFGPAPEAWMY